MSLTMSDPISLDLLAKHLQAIRTELVQVAEPVTQQRTTPSKWIG